MWIRAVSILLSLASCFVPLPAQIADDATLNAYLKWQESQPPSLSWDQNEYLARYRTKLEAAGRARESAGKTISALGRRLDADEAAFWSNIYGDPKPGFTTAANELLVKAVHGRSPGRALDVEMSQGRNAIFLAQQGWKVTDFDFSSKAIDLAQEQARKTGVKIEAILSKDEDFAFGKDKWDLIVFVYPMEKRSYARAREAIRPGGIVVVEGFHREAKGPAVRYASNELLRRFDEFVILYYEDGVGVADWGKQNYRLVKLVAQKPINGRSGSR